MRSLLKQMFKNQNIYFTNYLVDGIICSKLNLTGTDNRKHLKRKQLKVQSYILLHK